MKAPSKYKGGEVVDYPHLWLWQVEKGETEGRKDRPVCVALPIERDGVTHRFLIAVTRTQPRPDQTALELPEIEARRANLRGWKRGWVIVDEYNYDILEQSFYFDASRAPYGRFSETFMARIKSALRQLLASGSAGRIDRTE